MIGDILAKCFLIGILVSAPMGPVGMLCVQRSLSKGHWHGFASGAGATLSDLLYALLTGLGMSIVIDWVEAQRYILQLVGSILMILFGLIVVRTHPKKYFRNRGTGIHSYWQDFTTAFVVTFANALIILYYIALFARFGFPHPDIPLWIDLLGYLCIALGALSWWFGITWIFASVGKQINLRTMMRFNRSIGGLIIGVSLLGMIMAIIEIL